MNQLVHIEQRIGDSTNNTEPHPTVIDRQPYHNASQATAEDLVSQGAVEIPWTPLLTPEDLLALRPRLLSLSCELAEPVRFHPNSRPGILQ